MGQKEKLALYGGRKTRSLTMPARLAFGKEELQAVKEVFNYYKGINLDFGYQGRFEKIYTDAFVRYMGGAGFADALSSGTAALFVAIAALRIKPSSHVVVSPVTDPGTINAIILNRLIPVLADSTPNSFNVGKEEIESRITDKTKAILVVHAGGKAAPIDKICAIAKKRGLYVIEDCSQAHGAGLNGKKVGTFGDIGVFSTMYRKTHATGGCGGVIFTKKERLYNLIRAYADRGKPFFKPGFNDKCPSMFLFPALNLNIDEISCAIGVESLKKLDSVRHRRIAFLNSLQMTVNKKSKVCKLEGAQEGDSPFFQPVFVDTDKIRCSKKMFAEAIRAEGIDINPDYRYVVCEWGWVKPYLSDNFNCRNAVRYRKDSFNLLLNENYKDNEVEDIVKSIIKVEEVYS